MSLKYWLKKHGYLVLNVVLILGIVGVLIFIFAGCGKLRLTKEQEDAANHGATFLAALAAIFGGPVGQIAGTALVAGVGAYTAGHRRGRRVGMPQHTKTQAVIAPTTTTKTTGTA